MASRAENRVVNLAGLVQGITLVTFPAASSIFTEPTDYDLSNTQYGTWTAIAAAAMAVLSFAVAAREASPRELHPLPAGHEQPADSEARP